jgi:aminoglycoside 6-adenylyltransferase
LRTEQEMFHLIMGKAEKDDRIRAVLLNGSRANPNVKKDFFQDYDIVYVVRELDSFTSDHRWVDYFGSRIMMQMPEDKVVPPPLGNGVFVYLMWFQDGNRIDLTLLPEEGKNTLLKPDSLTKVLLEKDGLIAPIPPASDKDYLIRKPSEKEFSDTCNEFWWICMNIAKGLWRKELSYSMFMYEQINRNVLMRMLEWEIGRRTGYTKSAGKLGKYFEDFLAKDEWDAFVSTYSNGDYESIWDGLFTMTELFRKTARTVADHFGFSYPFEDDRNVSQHLKHIRNLPEDAEDYR